MVLGRQLGATTPWLTERHGYDPTCSVYHDTLHHCHIALHDHVVDIVFVAKPPL